MGNSVESFSFDGQRHPAYGQDRLFRDLKTEPSHPVRGFVQVLAVTSLLALAACASLPGGQGGNRQFDTSFSALPVGVGVFGGR